MTELQMLGCAIKDVIPVLLGRGSNREQQWSKAVVGLGMDHRGVVRLHVEERAYDAMLLNATFAGMVVSHTGPDCAYVVGGPNKASVVLVVR